MDPRAIMLILEY